MNVLLIGNGGREHALAWKISQSPLLDQLHIAPGNGGTSTLGIHPDLDISNGLNVINYCHQNEISLVVIGPEQPLVDGLADLLRAAQIQVIGPSKVGAQLEGSKEFSKKFMFRHNVPTARYAAFQKGQLAEAKEYIQGMKTPVVLKADGLAAGKGVLICNSHEEAENEIDQMLNGKFGSASTTVVVEEFLNGIEFSVFALTDGSDYVLLPSAKDYKRAYDGDQGLNTGGMGTVSPVSFVDDRMMTKVEQRIVEPTIAGLQKEDIPYCGFIFFGLISVNGDPFVIEYNARLGDPETQVILPRLENDLLDLFIKATSSQLKDLSTSFHSDTLVSVILASGGYPEKYEKNKVIRLQQSAPSVFQAGTKESNGQLLTNGGRVLACIGRGNTLEKAIDDAYQVVKSVDFDEMLYRTDIGQDLMKYETTS